MGSRLFAWLRALALVGVVLLMAAASSGALQGIGASLAAQGTSSNYGARLKQAFTIDVAAADNGSSDNSDSSDNSSADNADNSDSSDNSSADNADNSDSSSADNADNSSADNADNSDSSSADNADNSSGGDNSDNSSSSDNSDNSSQEPDPNASDPDVVIDNVAADDGASPILGAARH